MLVLVLVLVLVLGLVLGLGLVLVLVLGLVLVLVLVLGLVLGLAERRDSRWFRMCARFMIGALRGPLGLLRRADGDLADQVRRAASAVALNIAEGAGRIGKDRPHHYRVAAGSNLEVAAGLRVAVAWGHLEAAEVQPALEFGRRVGAMLWRMTH